MDKLNNQLREKAISLGLCANWQGMWTENWDNDKLADMMYKGIDFCIKNRYPSKEFFLENFDLGFLRRRCIFVNDKRSTNNPAQSLILGRSDIKVRYNGYGSGVIFALDNTSVTITAKNRSFVIVHAFDNAVIKAEKFDVAKIVVLKHSPNVIVIAGKDVDVKEEYDYLKD